MPVCAAFLFTAHRSFGNVGSAPSSFKIRCDTIRCAARIALPLIGDLMNVGARQNSPSDFATTS
jgi:hypothetical protein